MTDIAAPGASLSPEEARLARLVARRYYLEDQSKVAIAAELNVSRFKIARLLDRARAEGLVTVTIDDTGAIDAELSQRLADLLDIPRVLVADPVDPAASTQAVADLAAAHLREQVRPGSVLGIGWSRAVRTLTDQLGGLPRCTVVQLCGVIPQVGDEYGEDHSVELVRKAAKSCGGDAVTFYAPLVLPNAATAATLRAQPGISEALQACDDLTVAVIAIGQWAPGRSTVYDALGATEAATFARRGAVLESCGMLLDAAGNGLRHGLQKRVVAVTEDQLRRAGDVVALATESERVDAIRSIARSGIVTTLVTHRLVAEQLLDA